MKKLSSFKRLLTLIIAGISAYIEWQWYFYYWFGELFPRWVRERLPIYKMGHIPVLAVYAIILLVFMYTYGATKFNYSKTSDIIFSLIFATFWANVNHVISCLDDIQIVLYYNNCISIVNQRVEHLQQPLTVPPQADP